MKARKAGREQHYRNPGTSDGRTKSTPRETTVSRELCHKVKHFVNICLLYFIL